MTGARHHLALVDRTHAVALIGAWVMAALAARVAIPRIDPDPFAVDRPLETLSVAALCLPVGITVALLADPLAWLAGQSPRSAVALRLSRLVSATLIGLLGALAWASVLPAGVERGHALGVWALLHATGVAAVTIGGLGHVVPFVVVAASSNPYLIPFEWNVLYNPERGAAVALAAIAVAVLAVALDLRMARRRA